MPRYEATPAYEHGLPEALGILLVNLGTPDEPTAGAVRRYLGQFLADQRVIEYPRWLWRLILHGVILRIRPARSAEAYAKIWTEQGSPLLLHSQDVASGLRDKLSARLSGAVHVELAMSYGQPSIDAALERLHANCMRRIVVLPMYPQYSGTTVGSVFDAVTQALSRRRWVPEFRFINHYHDSKGYIAALAASIRDHWDRHGKGERLPVLFSRCAQEDPARRRPHTTATARKRRAWSQTSWSLVRMIGSSAFSLALAVRSGCALTPTRRSKAGAARRWAISM